MKVFISWSGDLSHRIALSLSGWLPAVLPFVQPWVSSEDMRGGTRGGTLFANALKGTRSGIICVVQDNLTEPWLMFEAGALSQSVTTARAHPLLVSVELHELPGPLAQLSATRFSRDDMSKLIHALNSEAVGATLPTAIVDRSFNVCWPNLENRFKLLLYVPMNQAAV